MGASIFLSDDDLVKLTKFKWKSKQIEHLRKRGLPFEIDAAGHPVVTIAAVEGGKIDIPRKKLWQPPD